MSPPSHHTYHFPSFALFLFPFSVWCLPSLQATFWLIIRWHTKTERFNIRHTFYTRSLKLILSFYIHWQSEYSQLRENLGDVVVKLLDAVRHKQELTTILNEGSGTQDKPLHPKSKMASETSYLQRLKVALYWNQQPVCIKQFRGNSSHNTIMAICLLKPLQPHWLALSFWLQFVAHAMCQRELSSKWYGYQTFQKPGQSLPVTLTKSFFFLLLYPLLFLMSLFLETGETVGTHDFC